VKFNWLIYTWCLMEIFESAASSFILWSHPDHNHNSQASFNIDCNTDVSVDVGIRINHWRRFPLITTTARTTSKTKIAISGASAPYGNITTPSLVNINSNSNEPVEIPIVGPLLNIQKPIIIGDSIWLDPPTPLQWKAVEASVAAQHGETITNWKSRTASEIDEMLTEKINLATIAKSPLVAILHSGGKEYATIAAIEGIVTKNDGSINTSDNESFRESLASLSSPYYSDFSKIRLLAIGRAKLSHFTTKLLMDDSLIESHEYHLMKDIESNGMNSITATEPLLVARMELLFDSNERGKTTSSPVHALNRLSTFAQRVRFLQQDRQRIVRGLQAAQSRLEMAMDNWEDWDGIGSINTGLEKISSLKSTKSEPLDGDYQPSILNHFLEEYNTDENIPSSPTHSLPISPGAARCIALDNYGLGSTSSAFVSLTSMADVLIENLENYYSPTQLQSEEFKYEAFSWCALQSLQSYLSSQEIYEALYKCTNTCARLEILYHAMIKHKMGLDELAQAKSLELRNCGEECDLF
jgi:hypothetical protein